MTEQENRILFALIEPEGCWHEWDWKPDDNYTVPNYVCSKCNTRIDEISFPDFTIPEWRIRLQEWLFAPANSNFWEHFETWLWKHYNHGSMINKYVAEIVPGIEYLLIDYLRTDEAKEKFGWVRCPGCDGYGVLEGQGGDDFYCKVCGVTGKIKAPWLIELEK